MATTPRCGAGGKIISCRRMQRLSATPYHRPPPAMPPKSPNWFSSVVVPSARAIVSGAGKIISSIFAESESSSEDEDYDSEENTDDEISDGGGHARNENVVLSNTKLEREDYQMNGKRTGTKVIIEKLILQETFTREECDRMIKVLSSRVVGLSKASAETSIFVGSPAKNHDDADIYIKVALEAKKWFQYENIGSTTVIESAPGISKKRSTSASGSWNILEDLHIVRTKVSEEMLGTQSKNLNPSLLAVTASGERCIGADNQLISGHKSTYLESLSITWPKDAVVNAELSSDPASLASTLTAISILGARQNGRTIEALPSKKRAAISKTKQDTGVVDANDDWSHKNLPAHNHDAKHHAASYWLPIFRRWMQNSSKDSDTERGAKLRQEKELRRLASSVNYNTSRKDKNEQRK